MLILIKVPAQPSPRFQASSLFADQLYQASSVTSIYGLHPAGTIDRSGFACGLLAEKPYGLDGVARALIKLAYRGSHDLFSFTTHYFNATNYRDLFASINWGKKLFSYLNVGIGFAYASGKAAGYPTSSSAIIQVAWMALFNERLSWGTDVYLQAIKKGISSYPQWRSGIGIRINERAGWGIEVIKIPDRPPLLTNAIGYQMSALMGVHLGLQTDMQLVALGYSYRAKKLSILIAVAVRSGLGYSPLIGFDWLKARNPA